MSDVVPEWRRSVRRDTTTLPRTPTKNRHYDRLWAPSTPSTERLHPYLHPAPEPGQIWYLPDEAAAPEPHRWQEVFWGVQPSATPKINGHPVLVVRVEGDTATFMCATSMNNTSLDEHCRRGDNYYATHGHQYLPVNGAPNPFGVARLTYAGPEDARVGTKATYVKISETWKCRVEDLVPWFGAVVTLDDGSKQIVGDFFNKLTASAAAAPGRVSPPPPSDVGRIEQPLNESPFKQLLRKTDRPSTVYGPGGIFSQPMNKQKRKTTTMVSVA